MNTNDQKKPKVMTEFAPPANAGMTGADYSVGRGLDAGGLPSTATPRKPQQGAPAPAAGTRVGQSLRRGLVLPVVAADTGISAAEKGINAALTPARVTGGFQRDVYRGLTGQANPDEGKPVDFRVSLPRVGRTLADLAPGGAAAVAGAADAGQPRRQGRVIRPSQTAAATGPLEPAAAAPVARADGITVTKDADGNNVYSNVAAAGTGTPAVAARPAPVAPVANNVGNVQATTRRTLGDIRGETLTARNDVAAGLNPMSTQSELMRRLEISQGSFKGSPSARAAAAKAILGQMGALTDASKTGQEGANRMLQQGAGDETRADEAFARRQLDSDKFNVESQDTREHRRQLVDLEKSKPFQVGQGEDGGQGIVRADGSFTPITDASGAPVKLAGQQQSLSPDALLKAYTDRAAAIDSSMGTAEEKQAARETLESDPLFAPLRARKVQHVTPSQQEFLAKAKQANPGKSEAELIAYYQQNYGG